MKAKNIIEGLTILEVYVPGQFSVCAEHDVIYAGPDRASDVMEVDAKKLKTLGWLIDSQNSGRWVAYV
jgi:hypothetical protein